MTNKIIVLAAAACGIAPATSASAMPLTSHRSDNSVDQVLQVEWYATSMEAVGGKRIRATTSPAGSFAAWRGVVFIGIAIGIIIAVNGARNLPNYGEVKFLSLAGQVISRGVDRGLRFWPAGRDV